MGFSAEGRVWWRRMVAANGGGEWRARPKIRSMHAFTSLRYRQPVCCGSGWRGVGIIAKALIGLMIQHADGIGVRSQA
jgi:hypothetical protein